jgi:predicted MFS family arabinose efflux permease
LGISPSSLSSSSGSGSGGGGGGCFIDTAGSSVPGLLSVMLMLLTIGVVITHWRMAQRAQGAK